MSVEKSYNVTLKLSMSEWGTFESIRLLKSRSSLPEELMGQINKALECSLVPVPPVKTTVAIGNDAEQQVMNQLQSISKMNMDFDVVDTSSQTGHGDIAVAHQSKLICVEVKSYTKPVPMKEIEKYHKSLALSEYDAGIMIQMNGCGFAREAKLKSPIDIRIQDGKPSVYLTAVDMDILYPIINLLVTYADISCTINVDDQNDFESDSNELEENRRALLEAKQRAVLEEKRRALLAIHEKVVDLRACLDAQKKAVARLETTIESIAKLSLA